MPLALRLALQVTSVMERHISSVLLLLVALISPIIAETRSPIQERPDRFLALANSGYQALFRVIWLGELSSAAHFIKMKLLPEMTPSRAKAR
jgi:hypothetical protein